MDADLGASRTRKNGGGPSSGISAAGPVLSSFSPSSSYLVVNELSWFPPLDLSSPLDEVLFMYYVPEICPRCTMYNDSSNGFQSIIIPMSANHQSIMHSILAVAAFYRRRDVTAYEVVSLTQKENALVHVRNKIVANSVEDYDESIVLAIMLCVFEVKDGSGPDWAKHLQGGLSILQSKVQKQGSEMWAGGVSWWANKFFGYLAVNSATESEMHPPALLETPEFWLSEGFEVEDIDGLMGCSSEAMAITASVCNLPRARNNHLIDPIDIDRRSHDLECRLFDLKQHSTQLFMTLQETSNLRDIVAMFLEDRYFLPRAKILALTAEARRQAAYISLYICVQGIPVHRLEVQTRVMDCLLCITAVAQLMMADDSPVWGMTPLVWPLFVAGTSALQDEDRFQVVEVFEQLQTTKCLGNVARARNMVKTIWKQYDMETNVRHAELWRLYVDPNSKWPLSLA
ncbi:hypothetical protein FDECE_7058 [Fusarium decemcellulare]|nr:hypothetical protein FDECE_7058 [Fusarium decemcellulare]